MVGVNTLGLFYLYLAVVNAAAASCVYNAPFAPKCEATCGGCGLSSCFPFEIYGVTDLDVTAEEWALIDAPTSYINTGKTASNPTGLCTIGSTQATFPLVGGHKDFFDFKVEVQKYCIQHPNAKMATVTDPRWAGGAGVTHPCFVNCVATKSTYECSLGTTIDAGVKHSRSVKKTADSYLTLVPEGSDPCNIINDPSLQIDIEMFGMEGQMANFDMVKMIGSRNASIAYLMSVPRTLEDGSTFTITYDEAVTMVDLMADPSQLIQMFKDVMPSAYQYCVANPDDKFVDMAALSVPTLYEHTWPMIVNSMFASQLISENVKGLNAIENGCACNMHYFETNKRMLNAFMASGRTVVQQPCYKDIRGIAYSYNEVKNYNVQLLKIMEYDADGKWHGCKKWTCKNGQTVATKTYPFSEYTEATFNSFLTANLSPSIKGAYESAMFGNSAIEPLMPCTGNTCSGIKTTYRDKTCCGAA
jgi:hypothetical protein